MATLFSRTAPYPILGLLLFLISSGGCTGQRSTEARYEKARPKNEPGSGTDLSEEQIKVLERIGYFDRAKADNPNQTNVTKQKASAFEGYNLYGSRHKAEAYLTDMDGQILHTWRARNPRPPWMHMELQPDGDLLVIADMNYIARFDWNSKLLWKRPMMAHHDLDVDDEGRIYVLSHKVRKHPHHGSMIPFMDDDIVILDQAGKMVRKKQLHGLLRPFIPPWRLDRIARKYADGVPLRKLIQDNAAADTTHTNSIEILRREIAGIAPKGSVLISCRELSRIFILDPELDEVLWSWGEGELDEQHHATVLENGTIQVFDNGPRRKRSRVLVIDPRSREVMWSFSGEELFSRLRGAAQKLPNGNVLITESDEGHAIEVTPTGSVVWEFWNPDIVRGDTPLRAVIYRMTRYGMHELNRDVLDS